MTDIYARPVRGSVLHSLYRIFVAFPVACFILVLLSDIAYWQTENLLWLHFSEWLLLAGLAGAIIAAILSALDHLVGRIRPSLVYVLGGIAVLLLATLNNFIHTADGWTAVMPYGLVVSAATVIVMIVTGWFDRTGWRHV